MNRYGGHIHQLRFRQGHTYGEETHLVSKENPRLRRVKSEVVVSNQSDPYVTREFPDGLIPGYAGNGELFAQFDLDNFHPIVGYVPQRKFQHGNRYRIETDACTSETKATYENGRQKIRDLQRTIGSYPKTKSLNSDTVLRHFLDYHRAYHPTENASRGNRQHVFGIVHILLVLLEDRRPYLEGPMPGYKGYIPRMVPIGVGLGSRYHEAAQKSLNRFAVETTNSMTNFSPSAENVAPDYSTHAK